MKNLIKLRSRGGAKNYLKKLIKKDGSESLTYVFKTDAPYIRAGEVSDGRKFLDPSGGPMIVVGDYLEEAEAIVESIDFTERYGWTITFKKNIDDISSDQKQGTI